MNVGSHSTDALKRGGNAVSVQSKSKGCSWGVGAKDLYLSATFTMRNLDLCLLVATIYTLTFPRASPNCLQLRDLNTIHVIDLKSH